MKGEFLLEFSGLQVQQARPQIEAISNQKKTSSKNSLITRIKALESQLHLSETQREALRAEVEESQKALDDIRRQIADACVLSQSYHTDQDETE